MPDKLVLDANTISDSYGIVLRDIHGNEFRLKFDRREGGIIINKAGIMVDQITVNPCFSNEICVK